MWYSSIRMKFKKPNFKLKLPNKKLRKIKFKKPNKVTVTVILILLGLAITIFGRRAPKGNDFDALLPNNDLLSQLENLDEPKTVDSLPVSGGVQEKFFFEVFDLIKKEFWNELNDEQIGKIAKLGIEKLTEKTINEDVSTRENLNKILSDVLREMSEEEKNDFVAQLSDILLANLEPFGRSRLYNSKKTQDLSNTVNNVSGLNHYETLAVEKDSDIAEINSAYSAKVAELNQQEQTEEVQQELDRTEKAYEVLSDETSKKIYDELGVDPTIEYRLISPRIFYVRLSKFSPTTVQEFQRVAQKVDSGDVLDTLIIDLRGNIGGFTNTLPYILGPFIGNDQYAYQFFSRGEKTDFKTVVGWLPSLVRYKKVVVLTDDKVKSSGEIFASVLKKYNVGILVGTNTNGWGTTERVYRLNNQIKEDEQYSAMLVDTLTLRDDGKPIEGSGVEPHVNINNPNWRQELFGYFNYQELVDVVSNLIANP